MVNTHNKGVRMQLLLVKEFNEYMRNKASTEVMAIWNAPNLRPSKKPEFLGKKTVYSNKDYLGDWDIAFYTHDNFIYSSTTHLIQVKSRMDYKLYEHLRARYGISTYRCYLAIYQKTKPTKIEDRYLVKLPHFWLVMLPNGVTR